MGLFKDALKFPFKPFKRMWWFWISAIPALAWYLFQTYGGIWLLLLGIVTLPGWIIFAGYIVEINRSLILHKKQELPPLNKHWATVKIGFQYAFISTVLSLVSYYIPNVPHYIGWVLWVYLLLISPVLLIHFSVTRDFLQGFNLKLASKMVFGNFGKYLLYMVRIIGVIVIWTLASLLIVTIPVTMPALYLGILYLMAEFYKEASN